MSRPRIKNAKHRREYVVVCTDPDFHIRKYFVREGYKALILADFVKRYPDYDISIYVHSGSVCACPTLK